MAKFQVYEKRCDQCLFSDNKVVEEQRKSELIAYCNDMKTPTHFICHKSTIHDNGNVCCRGFWDKFKDSNPKLIIMEKIGRVEFVPLPIAQENG